MDRAREFYAKTALEASSGKWSPYAAGLRFEPRRPAPPMAGWPSHL